MRQLTPRLRRSPHTREADKRLLHAVMCGDVYAPDQLAEHVLVLLGEARRHQAAA